MDRVLELDQKKLTIHVESGVVTQKVTELADAAGLLYPPDRPRGRIALMRRIADGQLEVTQAFGQELYFCPGCLTCETACPAGVRYGEMFEHARADIEQVGVLRNRVRDLVRALTLRWLFTRPQALRAVGRKTNGATDP